MKKTRRKFTEGQVLSIIADVEAQRATGTGLTKALAGRMGDTPYRNWLKKLGRPKGNGSRIEDQPTPGRIQVSEVKELREENQVLRRLIGDHLVKELLEQYRASLR